MAGRHWNLQEVRQRDLCLPLILLASQQEERNTAKPTCKYSRDLGVMLGTAPSCLTKLIVWFALPVSVASNSVFCKLQDNVKLLKCQNTWDKDNCSK